MRKIQLALSVLLTISVLFFAVSPASAAEETYGFNACTNNNPGDVAIGEAQLRVTVSDVGVDSDQVKFIFTNLGPEASSITDVYFQDGHLLGIAEVINGTGVSFSQYASPPDLPGGNDCVPPFQVTEGFLADSDPPAQPNGVNPGETLEIVFNLINGSTYSSVVSDLESGALRIGIHVQGFASGGSESFVNEGFTAITLKSFDAKAVRGKTTLNWATGTEIDNAGFNLYRSQAKDGTRVKVNGALIAAQGGSASGASYSSIDAPGYGTFYYWLEDVSTNGTSTLHGPVKATLNPAFLKPIYRPTLPAGN